jgi:hypothetical protein
VVPVIAATSCLGGVHVVGIGARWPWPQDTRCHRGQHSSTAATITIGCSCAAPAIPAPVAGDSGRIRIDPPVSRWIAPVLRDRLHTCAACASYWLLLLTMFHTMRQMRVNALLLLSKLTSSKWIVVAHTPCLACSILLRSDPSSMSITSCRKYPSLNS